MNQDQRSGYFRQLKGKMKVLWGELTNNEQLKAEGEADKLYGRVQKSFGGAKENLKGRIDKVTLS